MAEKGDIEMGKIIAENGGQIIADKPRIITVKRGDLDPTKLFGSGWKVDDKETDHRSAELTEIDLFKIELVSVPLRGEERLRYFKDSGYIRLDFYILIAIFENGSSILRSWRKEEEKGNVRSISFDGTVFLGPGGSRDVICLLAITNFTFLAPLDRDWGNTDLSAVLAPE